VPKARVPNRDPLHALMRHQDGQRHPVEDVARDSSKDQLPNAAVAICTHDKQVGTEVGRPRQNDVTDSHILGAGPLYSGIDPVSRQMKGELGSRFFTVALVGIDHDDRRAAGGCQK
jgi:hypothetical protein